MCDTCERHRTPEVGMFHGWRRHWNYASYIFRHKWYVFKAGLDLGVPFLAALHDMSKFAPSEWFPYARHFYEEDGTKRTRLASDGFFRDPGNEAAFDAAWLHHIQHNKHHPQYWVKVRGADCACGQFYKPGIWVQYQYGLCDRTDILLNDEDGARCLTCRGKVSRDQLHLIVREMPMRYRLEMLADWIGAGMAQGTPDTLGWYAARGKNHIFGPETRAWIEEQLGYKGAA